MAKSKERCTVCSKRVYTSEKYEVCVLLRSCVVSAKGMGCFSFPCVTINHPPPFFFWLARSFPSFVTVKTCRPSSTAPAFGATYAEPIVLAVLS